MTKFVRDDTSGFPRCKWCRVVLPAHVGPGRPRRFCSQACRQWDWVARQRADELALSENELVIARDEMDRLKDQIYVLACAIEDVTSDLASNATQTVSSLRESLEWLLEAAEPVTDLSFGGTETS
jgi:hypothetical protein